MPVTKPTLFQAIALWLVIFAALFVATAAFAQEASSTVTGSTITLAPAIDLLAPYVVSILAALAAGLLGWISKRLNEWLGVEIDGRAREALHSAAMTGLDKAVAAVRERGEDVRIDLRSPVIAEAAEWVLTKGAPGAVKRFGLTPDDVETMLRAKLPRALREG